MAILTAQQIARELIHPTTQWHVVYYGDSRGVAMGRELCSQATEIAWSGAAPVSMNAAQAASHAAAFNTLEGGSQPSPNEQIPGEYVNAWAIGRWGSFTFTGETAPTSAAAQMAYGSVNAATFPLVHRRLISGGGAAKWRGIYRRHATGIVGGDGIRLCAWTADRYNTPLVAPAYASAAITDTTGSGLAVAEIDIPAGFDWAAYAALDAPAIAWMCEPGGANPEGTMVQVADLPWLEAVGNGIVHHDHSTNGGRWSWVADTDVVPLARWTDHDSLYGENLILWSSLGVNSLGDSAETNAVNLAAVIARFRAAHPEAPVVIDTSYRCSYFGEADATWRQAIIAVAAVTEGVLVLDTYPCRSWAVMNANGWIADGVHYNGSGDLAGRKDYASLIGDLVRDAANGGYVIHSDSHRTADAERVIADTDAGSAAGKLVIRDGTTVIATITLNDPCGTESGGVLTFAGFPKTDLSCDASGTPDNALLTDSDDNVVLQLSCGVGTEEVVLAKATYAAGEPLKIDSATYTAPV